MVLTRRIRHCPSAHRAPHFTLLNAKTLVVYLAGGVANRVFQANSVGFQRPILGLMGLKCLSAELHDLDGLLVQPHDLLVPLVELLQGFVSCAFFFHAYPIIKFMES
jgi:hypothetical protein